jgi:hypothetical protein
MPKKTNFYYFPKRERFVLPSVHKTEELEYLEENLVESFTGLNFENKEEKKFIQNLV